MSRKLISITLLFALLLALLSACVTPPAKTLEPSATDAVLSYADPMADNLLAGLKAGDYAVFSKDFGPAMLKAMDQAAFQKLVDQLQPQLGAYISHDKASSVQPVSSNGISYNAVLYPAKFEKGNVTVKLVFTAAEPYQIEGLFFQ